MLHSMNWQMRLKLPEVLCEVNTKNGKRQGKLLLKNKEISGQKAHRNLIEICWRSQMSFLIRKIKLCEHMVNTAPWESFWKVPPGELRDTFRKLSRGTVFTVCSHTYTLFWLRKTSVMVEVFQLSFHVFVCAFLLFSVRVFLSLCYLYFGNSLFIWSFFMWIGSFQC